MKNKISFILVIIGSFALLLLFWVCFIKYTKVVKEMDEFKLVTFTREKEFEEKIEQLNNEMLKLEEQIDIYSDEYYGIKAHGRLKVGDQGLMDENNNLVQLKGMSTHGITWYPRFTNVGAFKTLKEYGANVVRLAVYSEQPGSYQYNAKENMNYLYLAIENALAINMYVIVDWHVLREEDPNVTKAYAKEFFNDVTLRYGNHEGIIYEICNEPNGDDTSWEDVCNYADEIIPLIRENAPDCVIIVGTPNFCTDLEEVVANPLPYDNLVYSMHTYIDLSKDDDDNKIKDKYAKKFNLGIPIFVSEWGMKNTDKEIYPEQAECFAKAMEENNVSWCSWSLSNKDEPYSLVKSTCNKLSGWIDDDLTVSGKIIKDLLEKY